MFCLLKLVEKKKKNPKYITQKTTPWLKIYSTLCSGLQDISWGLMLDFILCYVNSLLYIICIALSQTSDK